MLLSEQLYDKVRRKFRLEICKMGMGLGGGSSDMGRIGVNKGEIGKCHRM